MRRESSNANASRTCANASRTFANHSQIRATRVENFRETVANLRISAQITANLTRMRVGAASRHPFATVITHLKPWLRLERRSRSTGLRAP
eukprot:3248844-Prymnesium_polylepis.1